MKPANSARKLRAQAAELLSFGKKKGAAEIEVSIGQGREFKVEVRDDEIESLTESSFRDLSLRVFVEGKVATASSSDLTRETLERLVVSTIARARLGGADPANGLPEREAQPASIDRLDLFDPRIPEMAAAKKVAFARQLERIGLGDGRVKKSLGASFATLEITQTLVNSRGFSGVYQKTVASGGVSFQGGEGENLIQDGWFDASTRLSDLRKPEVIARKAVDRVARLVGARKVETQNVPVIIEPPVAAALLLGFFSRCVSGPELSRKQSFLLDKLGAKIGSDKVCLVDDGLLAGGLGSRPFDSEGVPSRRIQVVDKGVLQSYLLDSFYGRKLKLASTGSGGGLTNFYWAAGDSTPEAMIKSVDRGLLLTGTLGQGTVPTTGDISIGAFGVWIEKGALTYPVADITVSSNLGELLQRVEMVGTDLEFRRNVNAPTIKVSEMTVGGKAAVRKP